MKLSYVILEKKKNKKKTISLLCKLDHFVLTLVILELTYRKLSILDIT